MGMFLCLSGVIGKPHDEVVASLGKYASSVEGGLEPANMRYEDNNCGVIQTYEGNTSIVYPYSYLEWDETAAFISKDLKAPVFSCHIHDGDLWMYILYVDGQVVDQFNPVPDYWDENISQEEKDSWKGDAQIVATFVTGLNPADIEKYLVAWPIEEEDSTKAYPDDEYIKEDWQLLDFLRKLKLPYPLDNDLQSKGETCRLWTKQLKLKQEKVITMAQSKRVDDNKLQKPWWKFW